MADAEFMAVGAERDIAYQVVGSVGLDGGGYAVAFTGTVAGTPGLYTQEYTAAGVAVGGPVFLAASATGVDMVAIGGLYAVAYTMGSSVHLKVVDATTGAVVQQDSFIPFAGDGPVEKYRYPDLSELDDGGFVLTLKLKEDEDIFYEQVISRSYDATGVATGTTAEYFGDSSNITQVRTVGLNGGGYVNLWFDTLAEQHLDDGGGAGWIGQRFEDGVGGEFYRFPAPVADVVALDSGGFAVATSGASVYLRLYTADGVETGAAPVGQQSGAGTAEVDVLAGGDLLVSWRDTATGRVVAQQYDASGALIGSRVLLDNGSTPTALWDVAVQSDGTIVFAESTAGGSSLQVYKLATPVEGDGGPNTFPGTSGTDFYRGLGGADVIHGLGGDDQLEGGAGNDTLVGGAGFDTLSGDADNDRLEGGAGDRLRGGSGDDLVIIDGLAVEIDGGAGFDTLRIGVNMVVDPTVARNFETFQVSGSRIVDFSAMTAGVSVDILLGSGARVTGSMFADTIIGDAGVDTIFGGVGDTLRGEGGNDLIVINGQPALADGGGGTDTLRITANMTLQPGGITGFEYYEVANGLTVSFLQLGGPVTAYLLSTGGGGGTITGTNLGDQLIGGAGVDHLWGRDGDDVLDGRAGIDKAYGGAGNDIAIVNDSADLFVEGSGEGVDKVISTASYTLGNNVENLTLVGTADIDGVGNTLNNNIYGNTGQNWLEGGRGIDSLSGGAGADTFVFSDKISADRLNDFVSGVDEIAVRAATLPIGDGDAVLEGAVSVAGPGGFGPNAELVIIQTNISGAITAASAAAVIGSASSAGGAGSTQLFVVDNGVDSAVYHYYAGSDAVVNATELTLLGVMVGTASTTLSDYLLI